MILQLFSVYDTAAEEYGSLFSATKVPVAIRQFREFMADKKYAEDYQLALMGKYDTETGIIIPYEKIEHIPVILANESLNGGKA